MKKKNQKNLKKKQILEYYNLKKEKDNSNNNNDISIEENENIGNFEKNNIQIKKDTSETISKKKNKLNNIKSKSLFGDIYTKDLSKENNLFDNNKNSLRFQEKSSKDKNFLGSKKIKKKDSNSSSSSACKKKRKKKKKYSDISSGFLAEPESDSIEKKIKNKVNKKKKLRTKKENKLDNKDNSSSSSNYHPDKHNYLLELLPFMSSDSYEESLSKKKGNNKSEKLKDDEFKKGKENLDKKEENIKENKKENVINDEKNNEKNIEKNSEKEEEIVNEEEEEEKEEKNKIIEFNEKYNNTKNINSINYYTKKVKINKEDKLPSYDFIELKNSDDILYGYGTKNIYDCKNKKVKLKINNYNFDSEIIVLKDNYFIYIDDHVMEMIIFHFEEFNTKMIIDQNMELPENIEFDPDGPPFAPQLYCYPLNENFIIFQWSGNNNFYIYKNNSKEKNKFNFEQYKNIKLNKEAFIYINTSLKKILRINNNEFCIFAKSDQRPEPRFLFQAFMQGNKKHKEATYIAVYSFNSSKAQFKLKKSKINYEKGVDYGYDIELLRKRFIFYKGSMQKRIGKVVNVFDLETMQIIYIFKNMEIKIYQISDKKDIFFIIKNDNLYEQYQIKKNGAFKKIGEVKLQNLCIERKYKNGILYKEKEVYYLLTHE